MDVFRRLFKHSRCNVIGMIHLRALPGTPKSKLPVDAISEIACQEAEIYAKCGLDGVIVENMHDIPYVKAPISPEVIATMTRVCADVKQHLSQMPCGLQVLAAGNQEAVAIAHSTGFQFIRCEGFVFGHVADEGYIDSCAGSLLRYRKSIGAESVQVYCDVKKKHSAHSITADVTLAETAKAAEFFMADGLIVTGASTGDPTSPFDLHNVMNSVQLPVMIGSGVSATNMANYNQAHAWIIGSYFKKNGCWDEEIDMDRVKSLMDNVDRQRNNGN